MRTYAFNISLKFVSCISDFSNKNLNLIKRNVRFACTLASVDDYETSEWNRFTVLPTTN